MAQIQSFNPIQSSIQSQSSQHYLMTQGLTIENPVIIDEDQALDLSPENIGNQLPLESASISLRQSHISPIVITIDDDEYFEGNQNTNIYLETSGHLKSKLKQQRKRLKYKICQVKGLECSICFQDIRIRSHISNLKCIHLFHLKCLNRWGKIQKTCPLCRSGF